MSAPTTEQIDPQPFREWAEKRFIAHKGQTVALGAMARMSKGEFAQSLGLDDRVLDRWLKENVTLDRRAVEDALNLAGYAIWDVYADLSPLPDEEGPVMRRRADAKLTEDQVHVLYRMHVERGVSIRRLGRTIWEQCGFASPQAAGRAIGRAFARFGLPSLDFNEARQMTQLSGYNRCAEIRSNGTRCEGFAMTGSDRCWSHHPDHRDEARASALRHSPWARAAA